MDIIGISGLLVSFAGFGLALWQLHRTRRAAEAAKDASNEAVRALRYVNSIVNIQDICGRSRDLVHLTRARNLVSAATAAFELRDLVARFHATESGRLLTTTDSWSEILENIGTTHDRLESAAMIKRLDGEERESLIHLISRLHTQFSSFAATSTDIGVTDDNS